MAHQADQPRSPRLRLPKGGVQSRPHELDQQSLQSVSSHIPWWRGHARRWCPATSSTGPGLGLSTSRRFPVGMDLVCAAPYSVLAAFGGIGKAHPPTTFAPSVQPTRAVTINWGNKHANAPRHDAAVTLPCPILFRYGLAPAAKPSRPPRRDVRLCSHGPRDVT